MDLKNVKPIKQTEEQIHENRKQKQKGPKLNFKKQNMKMI